MLREGSGSLPWVWPHPWEMVCSLQAGPGGWHMGDPDLTRVKWRRGRSCLPWIPGAMTGGALGNNDT